MLTVITCTGDREIAFGLCRRWMQNQTIKPDQWIIIDDGQIPTIISKPEDYVHYIRRQPDPNCREVTLILNLKMALPLIKGDKILIMEDDEYYAPRYIEEMSGRLDSYEVVGIGNAKYYHLQAGGYKCCGNTNNASLAETGFRSSFLPIFSECVYSIKNTPWLDILLWKQVRNSKEISSLIFFDVDGTLFVGVKSLPGREGIGVGHKKGFYRKFDVDRSVLRNWIPKDYSIYLDLLK